MLSSSFPVLDAVDGGAACEFCSIAEERWISNEDGGRC